MNQRLSQRTPRPFFAALPGLTQVEIGRQAGKMGEQHANGDVLLARSVKFRQVPHHRIIQPQLAE